jgi:hypothetical protein
LDYSLIALSLVVPFNSNPTDLEHNQRSHFLSKTIQRGDRTVKWVTLSEVSDRHSSAKQIKEAIALHQESTLQTQIFIG